MKNKFFITSLLGLAVFSILVSSLPVSAATLALSPVEKKVKAGTIFSVAITANTKGDPVNAVETTVAFPPELLQVVSATPGENFKLGTPGSPSSTASSVSFSAGVPSPGYTGAKGIVGHISFKARTEGTARITVESGKILLNDGNATDVFTGSSGAVITITPADKPKVVEPIPTQAQVEAPAQVQVVAPQVVPQAVATPTPAPVTSTVVINTSDLFLLIYVLIALNMLLVIVVLILAILLFKRLHTVSLTKTTTKKL